jgi:eukaryotic-like serine/threonine-protein kinase
VGTEAATITRLAGEFAGNERYELKRSLGQGGMGSVYAVHDRRRGREVALKVLRDPERGSLFRFKREFRAMAGLRHPHLVRLFDLGVLDDGRFYFTMELVDGQELAHWVEHQTQARAVTAQLSPTPSGVAQSHHGSSVALPETVIEPPTPDQGGVTQTLVEAPPVSEVEQAGALPEGVVDPALVAHTLTHVALGLGFLHKARKVHRDLKPSNVMVDRSGRARLLDFGILRDLDDGGGMTQRGALGTPHYMAPEQVAGDEVGPASDLYSLGCMLYRILAGKPPFQGTTGRILLRQLRERPRPPSALRPCDPRLESLCLDLMAKEISERPVLDEVLRRLREVSGEPEDEAPPAPPPPASPGLLGREVELGQLERALEDARGGARVVLLAGESGSGKSALAGELALRVQQRGGAAWMGACFEREQVPYKALDAIVDTATVELALRGADAFRLLPPGTPALVRLFPVLTEVPSIAELPHETTLKDAQAERQRAARALLNLLTNLRPGQPPLLVLDDLQRADVESLDVLRWIANARDVPPCLVVGTYRAEEVGPEHPLRALAQDGVSGRVSSLALPPLAAGVLEEIAEAYAPVTLSNAQRAGLAEAAGGNPFLVVELARATSEVDAEHVPDVAELVQRRLEQVADPAARAALEVAVVAGGPAGFNTLATVTGLAPADLADALDQLLGAQLLGEVHNPRGDDAYALAHDRLREAAYDRLDPDRRRELHRGLAECLAAQGEAASAVEHWRLAGAPEEAREAALDAAGAAEAQLAFDRAAELYELATREGKASDDWDLHRSRARALGKAGRHLDAAGAYEEAASGAPLREARDLALLATQERLSAGDLQGGLKALDALLRPFGDSVGHTTYLCYAIMFVRFCLLTLAWFWTDLIARRLPWACREGRQPDENEAYRLRLYDAASHLLSVPLPAQAGHFSGKHGLMALRYEDPLHGGRARIGHAFLLSGGVGPRAGGRALNHVHAGEALCAEVDDWLGLLKGQMVRCYVHMQESNWQGVRAAADQGQRLARRAGLYGAPALTVITNIRVAAEILGGDLPQAVSVARSWLTEARARGNVLDLAQPLSMLGTALIWQGRTEEGCAAIREALAATPPEPLTLHRVQVELMSTWIYLVEGDPAGGAQHLKDLRRRVRCAGLMLTGLEYGLIRGIRARCNLMLRQRGEAGRSLGDLVSLTLPTVSSLQEDAERLLAACAFLRGHLVKASMLANCSLRQAERRHNLLGTAMGRAARARIREKLDLPGVDLDREVARDLFRRLEITDALLLRVEGWGDLEL